METILAPEVPADPPPEKKRHRVFAYLGIALGIFLAWFRSWAWSYGFISAEMVGHFVGSLILPAVIAYLIAGRKSVRNFNRFAVWFSWLSVLFFLVASKPPVSLSQHIGNLMKEASGAKPVDNADGPRNFDELIRAVMRDQLDQRKAFEQETEQYTAELGRLYSADSFSSPEKMKRSVEAVRGIVAADLKYSEQIEEIPKRIEGRVQSSNLSNSDKQGFMEGIRQSIGGQKIFAIRRQSTELEKQWLDATVGLYEFTLSHPGNITVHQGRLVASSHKAQTEFNQQLEKSQALRDRLVALNGQMESAQNEALNQLGVTPKEIGLPERSPAQK